MLETQITKIMLETEILKIILDMLEMWDPEVPFSYMFRVTRELLNYIENSRNLDYFTEF